MTKYVSYIRVSTQKQGRTGLGLDAQQSAIAAFCEPMEEYVEVESGKRNDRPQLVLALAACRRLNAVLVIAKIDRLARNLHFISGLMESGVEFIALDLPGANRLTLHIMAAFAESEGRMISDRTRAALQAAKRRGIRLGNPKNLTRASRRKGTAANSAAAKAHNETAKSVAERLRAKGQSLSAIAETLTGRGILTRRGKAWSASTVLRLLA